jgi:hypothetical protein
LWTSMRRASRKEPPALILRHRPPVA